VESGIGPTLRETRNRRKIDLSEVESATKIRLRYLRAMENEEWDVLPGGSYTRSFIRTYASFLGLDGERLADEFRRGAELGVAGERSPRPEPATVSTRVPWRRPRLSTRAFAAIVALGMVAVLVAVGLSTGGQGGSPPPPQRAVVKTHGGGGASPAPKLHRGVSVRLAASGEVWVCLIDASGKRLIDGQILKAGTRAGPYHSGSFTVSFGNGEVSITVNGQQLSVPATASPIGYSIDSNGRLEPLPESQRPTCT
jgi:cytoskeleton protein RodZ